MSTSERMNIDLYKSNLNDYIIYLTHMATYEFAKKYCKNKIVLDFGCGTGYGSYFISKFAKKVIAVDISKDAIEICNKNFKRENLSFAKIDDISKNDLFFNNETFDVVLSFQVIEHIKDRNQYLKEIKRVLKTKGKFLCATPDKLHRLLPFQNPWNRWHIYEYGYKEFKLQLKKFFRNDLIYGMGGKKEIIDIETKRYFKNKVLLYFFSLKLYPYFLRYHMIDFINRLYNFKKLLKKKNNKNKIFLNKYTSNDIFIKKYHQILKPINLIAVCDK